MLTGCITSRSLVEGSFATLLLVLPSSFEGGATCLSHLEKSNVVEAGTSSLHSTTVISWYRSVGAKIAAITKGYQLALLYDVVHAGDSPVPSLMGMADAYNALDAVLVTWRDSVYSAPKAIAYRLTGNYEIKGLSCGQLNGGDAARADGLSRATSRRGFDWGFAVAVSRMFPKDGGLTTTLEFLQLKSPKGVILTKSFVVRQGLSIIPKNLKDTLRASHLKKEDTNVQACVYTYYCACFLS